MNETNEQLHQAEDRVTQQSLRKTRSDSRWTSLSPEQRETLDRWLFEESRSYAEILELLKKEFGLERSRAGLARYYRHQARVRRSIEILEAQVDADKLGTMPARTEDLRAGAVKLVAKNAMALGVEKPEDVEGLITLTKVLLQSEENEIRLRKVKLEERYYDFEANTMCAKELAKVREYLRAVGDNENLSAEEKQERVIGLLFGKGKVNVEELEEGPKAAPQAKTEERAGVLTPEQRRQANSCPISSATEAQESAADPQPSPPKAERKPDPSRGEPGEGKSA